VKVLLLENIHPVAVEVLEARGFDVDLRPRSLSEDELVETLPGVHLLGIRSNTHITPRVLDAAGDLLAVGCFCIGTNQVDLPAAAERGIAVFNAPYSNTRSVVELVIAEMIALTRRLTEKNRALHEGIWDKSATGAHEMRGRTLGIVGYGNIGSQLSVLAEALGMRVICYDTAHKLMLGNARQLGSLDEVLSQSDIVTLHVDGRPGNAGMFGAEQFSRMKPGAVFLNLSRGFVLDNDALADALESDWLAGAAIDVFPLEPLHQGDAFDSVLRGLPNVILTPHIGGSTEEAQRDIGRFVSAKLRDYVADGTTTLSVNLPAIALQRTPGISRLALLHENTPGVLAEVNGLLGVHDVNVEAQVLATHHHVGYLLTDIDSDHPRALVEKMAGMSHTRRLRVV
jgi:D-3-phosphoglycerate dehydrogenase